MGKFCIILLAGSLLFSGEVYGDVNSLVQQLQSEPYEIPQENKGKNQDIFKRYCTGRAYDLKKTYPKYSNLLVKNAAIILQKTESDANLKLKEMFEKSWENTIDQIKENLSLLKTVENTLVVSLANKIENSLSLDATSFSEQQNKWYETLVDAVFVDVKKSFESLNSVVQEFNGVDFEKLKKKINEFKNMLETELRLVDIHLLKKLSLSFSKEFKSYEGIVNVSDILKSLKIIKVEFEKLSSEQSDSELKWVIEGIDYTISQLESNPDDLDEVAYNVQDVVFYFTEEDYLTKYDYSQEALEGAKVLIKQSLAINASVNLDLIGTLSEAIDKYNNGAGEFYNVRYAAEDLQRNLKPYVALSKDKSFIENSNLFGAEVASFNSENLMASVSRIEAQLLDANPDNDLQAASEASSVKYEVNSVKELLSEKSIQKYEEVFAEAKKSEQENIKVQLDELVQLASASSSMDFLDEASWQVSNLLRTLEDQKMGLSSSSQKLVEKFSVVSNSFDTINSLKYLMSSELELKKADHYYFYHGVRRIYKTDSGKHPYGRTASRFLVQLCGEFRDRASMIEAKLEWIQRLYTLPENQIVTTIDFKKNIWSQMSAQDYYPYLEVTRALWEARLEDKERYISIGKYDEIDSPVEGPTVCETKYIFEKYVKKGLSFDNLETYTEEYENQYRQMCSLSDQEDYYDFRGDSNFKHYSPESNGMIWKATSIARACQSQSRAYKTIKGKPNAYSDKDCQDYFKRPFYYRYNSARSSLATGLFYDSKYDDSFDSLGDAPVTIHTHLSPELAPQAFETETSNGVSFEFAPEWLNLKAWNQSDIGFNEFTGLGTSQVDQELVYERLRGSVDRHTNWYSAGYNDGNGVVKEQAFSPFVASSYVMSASDEFTECGITVQCPPDGLKRWMFIFRIKPQNWYNPQRILNNEEVDFDKMWFDETSFGDSGLANGESAWDRLGTAMESELDSILYLINVQGESWHGEEMEEDIYFEEEGDY